LLSKHAAGSLAAVAAIPIAPGKSPFRTKGLTYRAVIDQIERTVPAGLEALCETLEPALREFAAQPFLASSWYDLLPVVPISEAGARAAGQLLTPWLTEAAQKTAVEQSGGVYRFLLGLVSAETIALYVPRLTSRYFDFGSIETRRDSEHVVRLLRRGTPSYCVPWYRITGPEYVRAVMEHARGDRGPVTITSRVVGTHICPVTKLELSDIEFICELAP